MTQLRRSMIHRLKVQPSDCAADGVICQFTPKRLYDDLWCALSEVLPSYTATLQSTRIKNVKLQLGTSLRVFASTSLIGALVS